MKISVFKLLLIPFVLTLAGCCQNHNDDTVYQISTIDALLAGVYDGHIPCNTLLKNGNHGIGTFDKLDGEMIVMDSRIFKVKSNSEIKEMSGDTTTPFATICNFSPDLTIPINAPLDFDSITKLIDESCPENNYFYAIRIDGYFETIHTRSVAPQNKPYPPLAEVAKNQTEFTFNNSKGTVIGFRCPEYVKGINVPGYHLHYLSDTCKEGGHILAMTILKGVCQIDILNRFTLELPAGSKEFNSTDLSKDRTTELNSIER